MFNKPVRNEARKKRHLRVRSKISGTAERPRLNVYRSLKHIYVQIIDDTTGRTLISASTADKEVGEKLKNTWDIEAAKAVGQAIAGKAISQGINEVVFDRSGYKYHGRVKALADAAREAGLSF